MNTRARGLAPSRRIAAGAISSAIVASTLLIAGQSPASAANITVAAGDIRGDETTYAGWHQGYANAALNAAVTSGGLSLRGKSQVINGYADNTNSGLADGGVNANLTSLAGAMYPVTSGSAYFQVPLFVDTDDNAETPGVFATLRPAVASTGSTPIAGTDLWTSSKTFGPITANESYPLAVIVAAVNAHKSKTIGFGVLTEEGSSATVSSISFNGDTYTFAAAPRTATTVTNEDIAREETSSNYAEWHQGYANATSAQQVTPAGLVLAGKSQVIKGFSNNSDTLNTVNANLQFVLPEASYTVAPGSDAVYFQVPVKYSDAGTTKFTTLRNSGETAGTHGFALTDQWQSSKALPGIDANTNYPLSAIIAALGTNYKTIAVGVLTNPGDVGTVSNITFGTRSYTFADATPAPGSTEVVPVRTIGADETPYAGWHQGAPGGTATAGTEVKVLNLGSTKSQVIKGYENNSSTLNGRNANLAEVLPNASYTVTEGVVHFQVPLFVEDPITGSTVFTTLRNSAPAAIGTNTITVGQEWTSSKTVGPFTANEPYLLGDILSAFKTYKVLAFGVFSDTGGNGKITDITWDGVRYTFTGNRAPVTASKSVTTPAGVAITVPLVSTDADGDPITHTFASGAAGGTATITGTTLKYTPNAGFAGNDRVNYTATDGKGGSRTGVISIRVAKAATKLSTDSYTGSKGGTYITVKASSTGLVNGARVDIRRAGKPVATGKVVNGKVKIKIGQDLKKGTRDYGVYYRGTATSSPLRVVETVKVR